MHANKAAYYNLVNKRPSTAVSLLKFVFIFERGRWRWVLLPASAPLEQITEEQLFSHY